VKDTLKPGQDGGELQDLSDQGTVGSARECPGWRTIRTRIAGREFLIDSDAQSWLLIGVEIAVTHLGTTGKNVVNSLAETGPFLNAKVVAAQIEVKVGCVPNG